MSLGLGQGLVPVSEKAAGKRRRVPRPALAPVSTRVMRVRETLRKSSEHSGEESGEDGEWDCTGADHSERSSEECSSSEPSSDDERRRGGASTAVARDSRGRARRTLRVGKRTTAPREWDAPVVLSQDCATAAASADSVEWATSVRLQVTRPGGAAPRQVAWTADAVAPAAASFPARRSNPCASLTAEQCHSAARDEKLVLVTQDDDRGGTKTNATGFVGVLFKPSKKTAQ